MITAGLVQPNPERFAGARPMCGVLAGAVGVWNTALDTEFAFKTLLAPSDPMLQVVHITDPQANLQRAETLLAIAQATPQGRASRLKRSPRSTPWSTVGHERADRRCAATLRTAIFS
jgi:hypothetical protein